MFKIGTIDVGSVANMAKLRLTYMYVLLGIMSAALGLLIGLTFVPQMSTVMWIFLVIIEFGALFLFMYKQNIGTYSLFTFLSGFTLVPLISSFISMNLTYIVLQAFIGTLIITSLLTIYTLTTKKNFISLINILLYMLIGIIIITIINIFLGSSILQFILSIITMIVFSLFIIADTQQVLYTDITPLDAACSLYLDMLNMFIALLNILSFNKD